MHLLFFFFLGNTNVSQVLTLEALGSKYELTGDDFDMEVSDEHIRSIYRQMEKPKQVAVHLDLTGAEIEAVKEKAAGDLELMRLYVLQEWKKKGKLKEKPNYRVLIKALLNCGCSDSVIQLCELLKSTKH